jgi:uncharacterized tellurite resistance protein B-like protein
MDIDTETLRNLRDQLLSIADAGGAGGTGSLLDPTVRSAALRRITPYIETMYLVMSADGHLHQLEQRSLAAAVEVLTDADIHSEELSALLDQFAAANADRSTEARLAELGAHLSGDREGREIAFTLAAAIALADNTVDVAESRVLRWVCEYYGISKSQLAGLLG